MKFRLPPADGLLLEVPSDLLPLVDAWLPAGKGSAGDETAASGELFGRMSLSTGPIDGDVPDAEPTLRLGSVRAWRAEHGLTLRAADGRLSGRITSSGGATSPDQAELTVADARNAVAAAVPDALTIATASLLASRGHALMHAGAVVDAAQDDGSAWLVAGDARAGKSSTIAALVEAGHDWLSDDQVVLAADPGGAAPIVHGWPRTVHLDSGWTSGRPTGERVDRAPETLGPGRLVGRTQAHGVLLPEIRPGGETRIEGAHPTEALAALLRQSPWLMAMPEHARRVLGLLERVAHLPCRRLVLGRDSFGNGALLSSLLRDAGRRAEG